MRTGKTQQQIEYIKERLNKGETMFVGGMEDPTDYLNRLGEGYIAEESFRTTNINLTFMDDLQNIFYTGGEKIKTGYIFRKI